MNREWFSIFWKVSVEVRVNAHADLVNRPVVDWCER